MEGKARIKYLRSSPRKVRKICDLLRGKNVNEVLALLSASRSQVATQIEHGIRSAAANAEQKAKEEEKKVDLDNFYLDQVFVNQGPTLKRFRPRAMGRATMIRKRSSHLTVVLKEK